MVKTIRQELSDFVGFDDLTGANRNFKPVDGRAYAFSGYVYEITSSGSSQKYTVKVGKSPVNVVEIDRDKAILLEVFGAEAMDDETFRKIDWMF